MTGVKKNKKHWMRYVVLILSVFILSGSSAAAQEIIGKIEGKDNVFVSHSLQPVAGRDGQLQGSGDLSERSLKLYRSAVGAYYGGQLEEKNELAVYSVLAEASRNGKIKSACSSSEAIAVTLVEPVVVPYINPADSGAYLKLYREVGRAIDAFVYDYSENYWIYGYRWSAITQSGTNKIIGIRIWFTDYYNEIRSEFGITDAALAAMSARVKGNNRYEIVKSAYEEVIRTVIYPSGDAMPYHTITGGLLEKYGHKGVCDCYARIFRLLCQEKGIACILVPGGSSMVNGQVEVDHIWNYVQMEDGKWYLVDCTWDDQKTDTPTMVHFLAGSQSMGANSKIISQTHIPTGVFTNSDYQPFRVPSLSGSAYTYRSGSANAAVGPVSYKIKLNVSSLPLQLKKTTNALKVVSCTPGDSVALWKSSNSKVVKVDARTGKLTALKKGSAVITVTSWRGAKASCKVTVQKGQVKTKKLTLKKSVIELKKGKSTTIGFTRTPLTATDKITFKTSSKKVATVNSKGKITAKKKGKATITVRGSGCKAVKVTVYVK